MHWYIAWISHLIVEKEASANEVEVEDFAGHVTLLKEKGGAKIIKEFESLGIDAPFTQHAASLLRNKPKNRYKNVIPCKFLISIDHTVCRYLILPDDHSRVVLSHQNLLKGGDYINASHIDVSSLCKIYCNDL